MNVSLLECFSLSWKCFTPIWGQTPNSPRTAYVSKEVDTRFVVHSLFFALSTEFCSIVPLFLLVMINTLNSSW